MTLKVRFYYIAWRHRDNRSIDIFTQQKNNIEKQFEIFAYGIVSRHFLFWERSTSDPSVVQVFLSMERTVVREVCSGSRPASHTI
jgi:hypothetical protein